MKTRGIIAFLLTLCLIFSSFPALAAPARDQQTVEVTVTEGMHQLIDILLIASQGEILAFRGTLTLEQGQEPSAELTERALAAAAYLRDTQTLTLDEAKALYHQLFTFGEYQLPEEGVHTLNAGSGYTVSPEGLQFELLPAPGNTGYGAYLYSAQFDGTDVLVKGDLYRADHSFDGVSPEEIPEDALAWTGNAEFSLRFAPETEYGYTVNGFSYSPAYQAGGMNLWYEAQNTEYEYSVNLPDHLGLADDTPARMVWQSAEGDVTLTIEAAEGSLSFDEALAAFLQEHPGQTVTQQRLFDDFYSFADGSFTLIVVSEALPWHYTVTFTFPAERQAEYEFYSEIIRNSFSAWGISNG